MALTDKLTTIADAIRSKTGETDALTLDGMATAINEQTVSKSTLDALINRTATEVSSDTAESVGAYAFYLWEGLASADFPQVSIVGESAFQGTGLSIIGLPSAEEVSKKAFSDCTNLTTVNAPNVTKLGDSAFSGCTNLTTVNFPLIEGYGLGALAFYGCTGITTANFPLVTHLKGSTFSDCTNLATVDFPLVTSISVREFYKCSNLSKVTFPLVSSVGQYAFYGCLRLVTGDFPVLTSITSTYAFRNCFSLTALLLRSETMCTLANINAFTSAYRMLGTTNTTYNPDGLHDGYIYVPSALVESYQADSVWSSSTLQFRALEDYTVDGTITGELDESKI